MAIYSNGIKYGMAGYGKEYVGSDLVWNKVSYFTGVIKPRHQLYAGNDGRGIYYHFDDIKPDLSNVKTGFKITWRNHFPMNTAVLTITDTNFDNFDSPSAPDSSKMLYVPSSNYYTSGGFANPQVLSKDLYSGETGNNIKLPGTGHGFPIYRIDTDGNVKSDLPIQSFPASSFYTARNTYFKDHFVLTIECWEDYVGMDTASTGSTDYTVLPLIDSVEVY